MHQEWSFWIPPFETSWWQKTFITAIISFCFRYIIIDKDEKYNIYYWEISEDEGIKVAYYGGNKGTITADFDRDTLANSKVNFSRYSELQPRIKEGISYNDFKSYIGNVDGTITEKSSISTKYTWVSSDGSYLTASFSNSSNQCTFASGRVK